MFPERLTRWIEMRNTLPPRQRVFIRISLGLLGLLSALQMIHLGYPLARNGTYFQLPLVPGLDAVPPALHVGLIYALVPLSLLVAAGVAVPLAAGLVSAILYYVLLGDFFAFHHKLFLLAHCFLLLSFLEREAARPYVILAFRLTVCAVLGFAALNKMNGFFLRGGVIEALAEGARAPLLNALGRHAPVWALLAWASLLIELGTASLLPIRRLRPAVILVAGLFHLGLIVVGRVGVIFNLYLVTLYLFFVNTAPERSAEVRYPARCRGVRGLSRLDVLRVFAWREGGDDLGLVVAQEGRTYTGVRALATLARRLILINPLFLAFALVYLSFLIPWTARAAALFRETAGPLLP